MTKALALFLVASASLALAPPVLSGKNEQQWRTSINADINNKASNFQICKQAVSSAGVSDDVNFKNWAFGIARQYCAGTGIEGYDNPEFLNNQPSATGSPQTNTPNTDKTFVNGQPIPLCSHGGLCQGALMRAMGQP